MLNKSLKVVSNKISSKILQDSGLWDVPYANIKHGFLGSLVCYSLDPTLNHTKLTQQIQIHPNQFPYCTFGNIVNEKYNRIFTYVLDWIKCYSDVETQLPKIQ